MSVHVSRVYSDFLSSMETAQELSGQLRRADDFIRLGVQAGYETIGKVRKSYSLSADCFGLFLGTSFGTMETNFSVLDQVVTEEPPSPILFSHSVFNAAAGYIASIFDLQGCALTITDFIFPFFRALEQGYLAVLSGRLDYCLVLQIETYSTLLLEAKKTYGHCEAPWEPGVVCWLLAKADSERGLDLQIESLKIVSAPAEPHACLLFEEHMRVNGTPFACRDPLAAATLLTHELEYTPQAPNKRLDCRLDARYGSVKLSFLCLDTV